MSDTLDMLLSNLVLAAVVAVGALTIRRARPAFAHLLWLLVVLKLLTPPLIQLPITRFTEFTLPTFVPWVWGCGALVWLLVLGLTIRRFTRYLRFATEPPVSFSREVEEVATIIGVTPPRVRWLPGGVAPFVWSGLRPTLYFPATLADLLTTDQRRLILAHELAHLRRGDHVVRWLEVVVLAAYWWCPLAWVARAKLHSLQESCSDSEVLQAFPNDRQTYASAILDTLDFLAVACPPAPLATAIGEVHSLRQRLTAILHEAPARRVSSGETRFLAPLVALVVSVGFQQVDPTPDPPSIDLDQLTPIVSQLTCSDRTDDAVHVEPTPKRYPLTLANDTNTVAISSRGLLAFAHNAAIEIWDTNRQQKIITLHGHDQCVSGLCFSHDGRTLVSAGKDGILNVWPVGHWNNVQRISSHYNWIAAIAIAPDGRTLASAGYDRTVRITDLVTGQTIRVFQDHTAAVRAIAFHPNGEALLSGGADGRAILWRTTTGEQIVKLPIQPSTVSAVAITPDGRRLVTGYEDGVVRCWDTRDGKAIGRPTINAAAVTTITCRPLRRSDPPQLCEVAAVGFADGRLLAIDPQHGVMRSWFRPRSSVPHKREVVGILPIAQNWLSVSRDGVALVWEPLAKPSLAARQFCGHSQTVNCIAVAADDETVATGGQDGSIRIYDARTGETRAVLMGHTGGVSFVGFAGRQQLITCGADETVRIWSLVSNKQLRSQSVSSPDVVLAIAPDGERYAVGGPRMNGVSVWDVATGRGGRQIGAKVGAVTAVAFTPDGTRLLLGSGDGEASLWHASNGRQFDRRIVHPFATITGFAVNANQREAAVVLNFVGETDESNVHRVAIWEYERGKLSDVTIEHTGPISSAAFTMSGTLVTGGHEGNLHYWDSLTGQKLRTVRAHVRSTNAIARATDAILSAGDRDAKWWSFAEQVASQ